MARLLYMLAPGATQTRGVLSTFALLSSLFCLCSVVLVSSPNSLGRVAQVVVVVVK